MIPRRDILRPDLLALWGRQLDSDGKLQLDADGKIVLSDTDDEACCCGPEFCCGIENTSAVEPVVTFAGVTMCTTCGAVAATDSALIVSGSINHTYSLTSSGTISDGWPFTGSQGVIGNVANEDCGWAGGSSGADPVMHFFSGRTDCSDLPDEIANGVAVDLSVDGVDMEAPTKVRVRAYTDQGGGASQRFVTYYFLAYMDVNEFCDGNGGEFTNELAACDFSRSEGYVGVGDAFPRVMAHGGTATVTLV